MAIVSPFPPVPSGIAKYSFRLVEELAALGELDIDCFADGLDRADASPKVPAGLAVYDAAAFLNVEAATAGYDDVVYVLGNGEFHTAGFGVTAAPRRNRAGPRGPPERAVPILRSASEPPCPAVSPARSGASTGRCYPREWAPRERSARSRPSSTACSWRAR